MLPDGQQNLKHLRSLGKSLRPSSLRSRGWLRYGLPLSILLVALVQPHLLSLIDAILLCCIAAVLLDSFVLVIRGFLRLFGTDTLPPTLFFNPRLAAVVVTLVAMKAAWIVYFAPSTEDLAAGAARRDLLARRDYLLSRVLNPSFGPESSPQLLSPAFKEEWAIGTLSMVGAALANLSFEYPETLVEHRSALRQLIERMLEPDIREYERRYWGEDALETLAGENGHIGYLGHLNLLLGLYRMLGGGNEHEAMHRQISDALARRMRNSRSFYLETFPNQIYIPDNMVVAVSLSLYDKAYGSSRYLRELDAWQEHTRQKLLDAPTGMIVPWLDGSGEPQGRPRGSYLTWNIFYLMQVDRSFAHQQAQLVRRLLVGKLPFGACGVREYLRGVSGKGDIDSGPVIFGLSTSGTGFGLAAAKILEDLGLQKCLLRTAEIVGSTVEWESSRSYLLAPLIGDAIMLAMRTARTWDTRYITSLPRSLMPPR